MGWKEVGIGVGSAIGGCLLTIGGQVAVETYKNNHAESQAANQRTRDLESQKRAALDSLISKFDELGDLPRRAAEYAEGREIGSADDVRAVARHFRHLMDLVAAGRASPSEAALIYGGRLKGWAKRFEDLGDGSATSSWQFSDTERYNFQIIAASLGIIARTTNDQTAIDAVADQTMVANDTVTSSSSTNAM